MYIWSIKQLKQDLMANRLAENYKFYYFFIFVLLFTTFYEVSIFLASEVNDLDKFQSILGIVVQSVGLIIAYRVNGGKLGKDFLTRGICLYVVLCVRFIAYTLIAIASYTFFLWLFSLFIPEQYLGNVANAITVSTIPLLEIAFYWRFVVHMKEVKIGALET